MPDVKNEVAVAEKTEVTEQPVKSTLDYMSGDSLNRAYKNAKIIAESDLVPDTYRHRPENVLIALDMANRTGFGLMTVMQSLYLVHGRPAWSGQFCVAAVNGCGKFSPLSFNFVGEEGENSFGCYAVATRLLDGVVCKGTLITVQMAVNEGWMRNSKWKTMTSQMLMYRAASFFARTYCPEVLMGLQTVDEVKDVNGEETSNKAKVKITLDDVVVESEVVE